MDTATPALTHRRSSLAGLAMLCFILVLSACTPSETPSPIDEDDSAATDGLLVQLGAERLSYEPGDEIRAVLRLVNRTGEPRALTFSSAQRVDFLILDASGNEVFRWSTDQMFAQVMGEEVLNPEAELSWEEGFPAPPGSGEYSLVGRITSVEGELEASLPITLHP